MLKFEVVMMCGGCAEKITKTLKENNLDNFEIDFGSGTITFSEFVNPYIVLYAVKKIGYKIKLVEPYILEI